MSEAFNSFQSAIASVWHIIDWGIYLFVFAVLVMLLESTWLFHRQTYYKKATEYTYYEIKVPREIEKGPKAMEQFFAGLHAFINTPGSLWEKYGDGETTRKFTFELLGTNGSVHLFMGAPTLYCDAVKALLYAQYNDLEIVELEHDYLYQFPRSYDQLKQAGYEIWGMEAKLENKPWYPIKTYEETEEKADERIVDPIAFFSETISNMSSDETVMLQFVVKPATGVWQVKGEKAMDKALKKRLYLEDPAGLRKRFYPESEREKQQMKQIQDKVAKDGFLTIPRYIHIAPKATYNMFFGYRSFFAYFTQLAGDHNRFVKNQKVWTRVDWFTFPFFFHRRRLLEHRRRIYKEFLTRYTPEATFIGKLMRSKFWQLGFWHKYSILNTAELATLFHPPTNVVITTGLMDRVESKRVAPPSELPG